jgi:hypothetical protein
MILEARYNEDGEDGEAISILGYPKINFEASRR